MNILALSRPVYPRTQAGHTTPTTPNDNSDEENRKIEKSSKDFEALLLTSWFQKAYETFGSVPSNDDSDDLGSGGEQFQAIAMQGLASAIVDAGGIGIAKMMAEHLRKSDHVKADAPNPLKAIPAVPADISPAMIETSSPDGR